MVVTTFLGESKNPSLKKNAVRVFSYFFYYKQYYRGLPPDRKL